MQWLINGTLFRYVSNEAFIRVEGHPNSTNSTIAVIFVSLLNVMVSVRPSNIITVITETSTCCLPMNSLDATILSTQMNTVSGGIDPTIKQPQLLLQLLPGKYNILLLLSVES